MFRIMMDVVTDMIKYPFNQSTWNDQLIYSRLTQSNIIYNHAIYA